MKYLARLLLTLLLALCWAWPCAADQQTTILAVTAEYKNVTGTLPYIDGSNEPALEKQANELIRSAARSLAERAGRGSLSYQVALNRPSLVGLLLEAAGERGRFYQALNLDLTSGRELGIGDFFVNDPGLSQALAGSTGFLYSEEGLRLARQEGGPYEELLPYSSLLPYLRIGEAGRLLQIARLTRSCEGKLLRLERGGLIAFKLDANPSSGNNWTFSADQGVSKVGSSFLMPAAGDTRTGTPGTEILFLAVSGPGTHVIKMAYKRPWENFSLDSFQVTVEVGA